MLTYSFETWLRDVPSERVQITTDGLGACIEPIQRYFKYRADRGSEVKDYGLLDDESPGRKYSPTIFRRRTSSAKTLPCVCRSAGSHG
jgi:hypothetical protein